MPNIKQTENKQVEFSQKPNTKQTLFKHFQTQTAESSLVT